MNLNVNAILLAMFPSNIMDCITLVVDKYTFYVFLIIRIIGYLIVNMFFLRFAYLIKSILFIVLLTNIY